MPIRDPHPDLEFKRALTSSIRKRMEMEHLSISALAERMGTGRTAVRRILDDKNTSITFRSMSRAANAVGLVIKLVAQPMSPGELGKLASRLVKSQSSAQARKHKADITRGFYAGT